MKTKILQPPYVGVEWGRGAGRESPGTPSALTQIVHYSSSYYTVFHFVIYNSVVCSLRAEISSGWAEFGFYRDFRNSTSGNRLRSPRKLFSTKNSHFGPIWFGLEELKWIFSKMCFGQFSNDFFYKLIYVLRWILLSSTFKIRIYKKKVTSNDFQEDVARINNFQKTFFLNAK